MATPGGTAPLPGSGDTLKIVILLYRMLKPIWDNNIYHTILFQEYAESDDEDDEKEEEKVSPFKEHSLI